MVIIYITSLILLLTFSKNTIIDLSQNLLVQYCPDTIATTALALYKFFKLVLNNPVFSKFIELIDLLSLIYISILILLVVELTFNLIIKLRRGRHYSYFPNISNYTGIFYDLFDIIQCNTFSLVYNLFKKLSLKVSVIIGLSLFLVIICSIPLIKVYVTTLVLIFVKEGSFEKVKLMSYYSVYNKKLTFTKWEILMNGPGTDHYQMMLAIMRPNRAKSKAHLEKFLNKTPKGYKKNSNSNDNVEEFLFYNHKRYIKESLNNNIKNIVSLKSEEVKVIHNYKYYRDPNTPSLFKNESLNLLDKERVISPEVMKTYIKFESPNFVIPKQLWELNKRYDLEEPIHGFMTTNDFNEKRVLGSDYEGYKEGENHPLYGSHTFKSPQKFYISPVDEKRSESAQILKKFKKNSTRLKSTEYKPQDQFNYGDNLSKKKASSENCAKEECPMCIGNYDSKNQTIYFDKYTGKGTIPIREARSHPLTATVDESEFKNETGQDLKEAYVEKPVITMNLTHNLKQGEKLHKSSKKLLGYVVDKQDKKSFKASILLEENKAESHISREISKNASEGSLSTPFINRAEKSQVSVTLKDLVGPKGTDKEVIRVRKDSKNLIANGDYEEGLRSKIEDSFHKFALENNLEIGEDAKSAVFSDMINGLNSSAFNLMVSNNIRNPDSALGKLCPCLKSDYAAKLEADRVRVFCVEQENFNSKVRDAISANSHGEDYESLFNALKEDNSEVLSKIIMDGKFLNINVDDFSMFS